MSYALHPGLIRTPNLPYPMSVSNIREMWIGDDEDSGFIRLGSVLNSGKYVIVRNENLIPSVKIGGSTFAPSFDSINGYVRWGNQIYYSVMYGWVYVLDAPYAGYEPIEYADIHYKSSADGKREVFDYKQWGGNRFYTFNRFPSSVGETVNLTKRGALKGREGEGSSQQDDAVTLEFVWPRWESDEECGEYEGEDDAEGTRMFGLPTWVESSGGTDVYRSVKRKNGYFTYGEVHNDKGHWVIGTYGTSYGWWQGSEPTPEQECTFTWVKGQDFPADDKVPADITYKWKWYEVGEESNSIIVGDVSKWR